MMREKQPRYTQPQVPETKHVFVGVDIQNDFADPGGSLYVQDGETIIPSVNEVTEVVRAEGGDVIFTRDWHPAETPHFESWPVHCVAETEGAALHPGVHLETTDIIISKGAGQTDGYSGWEGVADDGATLETLLTPETKRQTVAIMLGGLATDYCVKATALDIAEHFKDDARVQLYLLRDAVRAVNLAARDGDDAIAAMEAAGIHTITTVEAKNIITEQ